MQAFQREPGVWVEYAGHTLPPGTPLVEVVFDTVPAGEVELTRELVDDNGSPHMRLTTGAPVPPEPAAEAERLLNLQLANEFDIAKLDAWIVQFLAMTPSGAQDFVNNNSATLAALRLHVARLAYAVRVLVKREFRQ